MKGRACEAQASIPIAVYGNVCAMDGGEEQVRLGGGLQGLLRWNKIL